MESAPAPNALACPAHATELRRLERILAAAQGFRLVFLQFNDPAYRERLISYLNQAFGPAAMLRLPVESRPDFLRLEAELAQSGKAQRLIHLVNLESWLGVPPDLRLFRAFNYHRETLAQVCPIPLLVWLTGEQIKNFALNAPDLWAWRAAVLEFDVDTPLAGAHFLLTLYLNQVVRETSLLYLAGVDRKMAAEPEDLRLELAGIYTALDAFASKEPSEFLREDSGHPLREWAEKGALPDRASVTAFVSNNPCAALLGDPGSGKSTFANFLALTLAGEELGLESANLKLLGPDWQAGALLPIRVLLREWAAQSDQERCSPQGLLWDYILERLGQGLSGFVPILQRRLEAGSAVLILDGLDEVPEARRRREVLRQAVLDFQRRFPKARLLLTSRTYAYQNQQWRLPGFAEAVLAPFNDRQIDQFVERWYAHWAKVRARRIVGDVQGRAALLKHAIHQNPYLTELARRPLLLTLMASLHSWRGGSLPEQRERLYDESVELLLDIWERPKTILDEQSRPVLQTESAAEWFRVPHERIVEALEALAFQVHQAQAEPTGTADIPESDLEAALLLGAAPGTQLNRVRDYIRDRAGLLLNRGEGVYSFPHRTFQEYLAARHLTRVDFPEKLIGLLAGPEVERWREVVLLAGARLARFTPFAAWTLITALCPRPCDETAAQHAPDTAWWRALLAGQLLIESGLHQSRSLGARDAEKAQQVRNWLCCLVAKGHLPPRERAEAGNILAALGDPRPGVAPATIEDLGSMEFCYVPPGPFIMGEGEQRHRNEILNYGFWLSRYPVTVAQFDLFIKASGYREARYWPEAEAAQLWCDGKVKDFPKDDWQERPAGIGAPFNLPNHPVVNLNWFEALAFCRWLSDQWQSRLPSGYTLLLPSEAEWEKAARGGERIPAKEIAAALTSGLDLPSVDQWIKNPEPDRTYPWRGDFDPNKANALPAKIGATSAVGAFPHGACPCGALDMAGNVWEWTRNLWGKGWSQPEFTYPYEPADGREQLNAAAEMLRVLRGGSWDHARNHVRCACRLRLHPDARLRAIGFRVVASPFVSGH